MAGQVFRDCYLFAVGELLGELVDGGAAYGGALEPGLGRAGDLLEPLRRRTRR